MAYNIIFYEKQNGECEIWEFLEELRTKSEKNKDYRIQYNQVILCIELLQNNGTFLPANITKHIEDNIWELRPGINRIFYFYHDSHLILCLFAMLNYISTLYHTILLLIRYLLIIDS